MKELNTEDTQERGSEVNVAELLGRLRACRRTILRWCAAGIAAGVVIAFSIPREYEVSVLLAPEMGGSGISRGMANFAAMFGLNPAAGGGEADALGITLFPEIIESDPFALELYDMPVPADDGTEMPLNDYMAAQRMPWWSRLAQLPARAAAAAASLFARKEEPQGLNPFRLTPEQRKRIDAIKDSMRAFVDKRTGVTTVTVTLQNPLAAAVVADSVIVKLQRYITDYRTRKAAEDADYLEMLCRERQEEYYRAQQAYADYVDGNRSLYTRSSMVEGERLQNEMNQAFNVYNQLAAELQIARARVQEARPVFAVVNPATVPVRASAPRKFSIVAVTALLAAAAACAWALWGRHYATLIRRSDLLRPDGGGDAVTMQ